MKANFYYHALNVLQNSCLKIQPQFHIINSVTEHNRAMQQDLNAAENTDINTKFLS